MPDALVGVGGNGEATLVIAKAGTQPVLLEEGDILGMAVQELDLDIQYCPGKTNSRADALSVFHPDILARGGKVEFWECEGGVA